VTEGPDQPIEDTGIRVIPPFVLLGALALAFILDWIWPSRVGLPDIVRWVLGAFLIVVPFLILPSVLALFRRTGSHYDVRRVPQALVTEGVFRFTRNPGYVLGVAFCAGVGLAANNPWVFLALVPAIVILHYSVILREEVVLENKFGEDYLEYKRRVRRWI
jgi:protein-S-isoprenylcysteine O-methyltransferase Ste14